MVVKCKRNNNTRKIMRHRNIPQNLEDYEVEIMITMSFGKIVNSKFVNGNFGKNNT